MMLKKILCLGNIAFDFIQLRKERSGRLLFDAMPGGSVFNTAVISARLGLDVAIVSKTGRDVLGKKLVDTLKNEHICTDFVIQDPAIRTGLALAAIDKKGDSSYVFYKPGGRENAFRKGQAPVSLLKDFSVLHTASAYTYGDHTYEDSTRFLSAAKKNGLFIFYDPNWRENRVKNVPKALKRIQNIISLSDMLKLSEADALALTRAKTLDSALKKLPENIIVTLGAKGSFFFNGKTKIFQPAFRVKTVDTIGAGDAFTAGLIRCFRDKGVDAFSKSIRDTLKFASAASAIVCKARGACLALKSLKQVNLFLSGRASCGMPAAKGLRSSISGLSSTA
ncbi:MAG: carbohydrate kinase [Candidatus Omnitrophota bacterium]